MKNFRLAIASWIIVVPVMITQVLPAQSFIPSDISFPGLSRGEIAWCDYDKDHDLDIFLTGLGNNGESMSVLYRNDEGQFADCGLSFIPAEESMASWGDFDLDGDMDLVLSGTSPYGDITLIYRNDGSYFTPVDAGIPAVHDGTVQWVDFDGDNDLDVFVSGNWVTEIYRNDNAVFTDHGADFGFFSSSAASFGDYDNDGDLDLLLTGDSGAGTVSKVFKNDAGYFADALAGFNGLMAGTADWIDYDLDGDLDAAISGFDDALEARFYLYKNSEKQFEIVYAGIEGFAIGAADWGDYDNDGDPDLIMSGKATGCGAYVSGIYRNEGNDYFYKTPHEFTTASRCSANWADYENDGDIDFIISGLNTSDIPVTRLYINNSGSNEYSSNSVPASPQMLQTNDDGSNVTLSWSAAVDNETPVLGLSYNLRLGSFPGANDIVPAMAEPATGLRFITGPGNTGQTTAWKIMNLEPGTYYWSVQAIDQAFEGSAFAPEESFTIAATGAPDYIEEASRFRVYPNPARDDLFIQFKDDPSDKEITLTDQSGQILYKGIAKGNLLRLNVSGLKPGYYAVKARGGPSPYSVSLIKAN